MKAFLMLVFAVAIAFVSYQYVYPPLSAKFGLDKPLPKPVVVAETKVDLTKVELPKVEMKPEPKPQPKPEPKPEVTMAPPPPPPPVPEPPKPKADEFQPPEFQPIDTIVGNWLAIPKSVFPRPIKCNKDVVVKGAAGGTTIKAGGAIFALGQDGMDIIVASAPTSPFKGKVALDETDLKSIVTAAYENWKVTRVATLKKQYEQKKIAAANPGKSATGSGSGGGDGKPEKDKDGAFPMLLASMKSGEVTEIKPDNIKKWGDAVREKIDGDSMWTVTVTFEATTPFGKFETDAQAQIKSGKVAKWIYTGTGEVVP